MRIETPHKIEDIQGLAEEWRALLPHGASHVPFLTPEFLTAWWGHLGGGEWPRGELCFIVLREDSGELVGIAPLFLTDDSDGEPVLMFLGSHEIADFLDFIVRPADLDRFLAALFDLLSGHLGDWRALDLYNLLDNSPTLSALEAAAQARGWAFEKQTIQPAPFVSLPANWETYLSNLDKKDRHELRRKMRRAAGNVIPVSWHIVEDGASLDAELDTLFALMAQEPDKERFLTPSMQLQMRTLARAAHDHGWLQMAVMQVGREKVVAQLNFDYAGRMWGYNSGVSQNFRELATGLVLTGHLIELAIQNGRTAWDFMRGDEEYKYRFGAQDRHVMRAVIRR